MPQNVNNEAAACCEKKESQLTQRKERLRYYTNDPKILEHVEWVAFNQEELEDILNKGDTNLIYLCQNIFRFTSEILSKRNMLYVGIGKNAEITIKNLKSINFNALGIVFSNVKIINN